MVRGMNGDERKICVDPGFFNLEIYAIYHAMYDLIGEDAWRVVWKVGEIVYAEMKEDIGISGAENVFDALKKLAEWLKRVGYVEDAQVRKVAEDEVEYVMLNPIIGAGAKRLIEEKRVPAHISTALMFAALKQFNMKAEIVGEPAFLSDGKVVERWRLIKV